MYQFGYNKACCSANDFEFEKLDEKMYNMGKNISLKSIEDFETQDVQFYIPNYQRGYRWKSKQVNQLIDDIESFIPTENNPFYFLQALAVAKDEVNNRVNVVDGQQRLTTLKLILGDSNNSIHISYAREADKALDNFFKKNACSVIEDKLGDSSSSKRVSFCEKLRKRCRFLYYEVSQDKELSTFDELNSGKIPVKDSELVKCVMLTLSDDESSIHTNDRAKEWDEMERMLNNNDFFSFITPQNAWKEDDRMTVLLRYAGIKPTDNEVEEEVFPFLSQVQELLKVKSRKTIWKSICAAYYRLLEWFNDPLMYHALGVVVHRRGNREIFSVVAENDILSKIEKMANYIPNKEKNDYYKWGEQLFNYLLLSNVAFCWKRWPYRYSFSKHREVESWSIEHIFARNQRDLEENELKEWLGDNLSIEKINEYKEVCNKQKGDEWLAHELGNKYPAVEDNSLQNLALLPQNANSSLNNKLFEGKRAEICKWANERWGTYWAPPVTEAIFMKSFVGLKMSVPFWSDEEDKPAYINGMKNDINEFVQQLKTSVEL